MGDGHDKIEIISADVYDVTAPWTDRELEMLGLRSAADGGLLFCGVTDEQFAINGVRHQWPKGSKLAWSLGFTRLGSLSDLDLKGAVEEMLKEISQVCDLDFEYTSATRRANILIILARLDGPSGVLADMGIPMRGSHQDRTQLTGRVDDSETWVLSENPGRGQLDYYRTQLHEFLHACGLGHQPVNASVPALIAPMYSPRIRHLQAPDIAELQTRYGKREPKPDVPPTPPLPPAPGAEILEVTITVKTGDKQVVLSGTKPWSVVQNILAADDLK